MNAEAPGPKSRIRPVVIGGVLLAALAAAYFTLRAPAPAP